MKTYLVTGGAGFIGSNFIHYMFKKYGDDIRIINVDKLTYAGNLENLSDIENRDNYSFIKADITDKSTIQKIFEKNDIDRVIHFAAESHVDRSIETPEVFVNTNVVGTAVMLNCAKKAWELEDGSFLPGKKFVHISTDEVYGSLPDDGESYFYETTPYAPHSPYSASKAGSDLLVKSYMDTYGFPANITNTSNNYGPYQFPEKLIPLMINNALQGEKLPVYGDGKNVRDWLYVDDHAKGIDIVSEKGKLFETYNIGGHNEKRNIEIVNLIIQTLLELLPDDDPRKKNVSTDLITYVTDRKGHDRRYAIAPDKIKNSLGWEPETRFEDGIKKTVKWYLDNEKWLDDIRTGAYRDTNNNVKITVEKNAGGIEGLCVISPKVFGDKRGYFMESYNYNDYKAAGIDYRFVQDNQSSSKKGVLRGLHYQINHPQAKLVRVIRGEVYDVAVDLRKGSKTYGKWYGLTLSADNKKVLFIPEGFAHGFLVLSDEAEFEYKVSDFYNPGDEGGIRYDDPDIGVEWPFDKVDEIILSDKDKAQPYLNK